MSNHEWIDVQLLQLFLVKFNGSLLNDYSQYYIGIIILTDNHGYDGNHDHVQENV